MAYEITVTDGRKGYIKCPVCGDKMSFVWIEDTHEYSQPHLDVPKLVLHKQSLKITGLHCTNCSLDIPEMHLALSEEHQVKIQFVPPIALSDQLNMI